MSNLRSITEYGLETVRIELKAIENLLHVLPESDFEQVVNVINSSRGKVVLTGIGKSALVAQKIAATLNSTGTPAVFMHAADAVHGDIGIVEDEDVVIVLSNSGESPEIKVLVPVLLNFNVKLVAITGNSGSYLAKRAHYRIVYSIPREACPNNLAPTASTTAQLVIGDAIAMALARLHGFTAEDFARLHPGGTLGKRLYLRVADVYIHNPRPYVYEDTPIPEVIVKITEGRLGAVAVLVRESNKLKGIITDGDIRRMLQHFSLSQIDRLRARDVMSSPPKTIQEDDLAVEALDKMRKHKITQLIVTDSSQEQYLGMIHMHDLVREGLV